MAELSVPSGKGSLVKSYSKLKKIHGNDTNRLSTKLIERLWPSAIFQSNDDKESFESSGLNRWIISLKYCFMQYIIHLGDINCLFYLRIEGFRWL